MDSHAAHGLQERDESAHASHAPSAGMPGDYREALDSAQPVTGGRVVKVDLEPREVDWEFSPGRRTRAWGFNGQIPGPVIEARVGDVLEVHLRNSLPEPTIVHWHGIRLTPPMDGTESTQRPVAPGETFIYRFALPDAGTFWYHPHFNETVQLERGLCGALIVRGPDEPVLDAERVLVLDDVKLDREGQIEPPGGVVERHDGRQGDVRLVNGRQDVEMEVAAGQVERWRVINAASARYVRLSVGGRPFRILGTDGGLIEAPFTTTEVLLGPSDRVDLAVGPFDEGEVLAVEALKYATGTLRGARTEQFATVRVGPAAPSRAFVPDRLRTIEPLVTGAVEPTREVRLGFKVTMHGIDFTVNRERHHRADPVRVGELQVWDIVNGTRMDHPFHLHGFFFQVLEVNGEPPAYRSWEDTVNIPPAGRVRIAWMPDDRPGEWMYHCHILEHHASGMMAHFEVVR